MHYYKFKNNGKQITFLQKWPFNSSEISIRLVSGKLFWYKIKHKVLINGLEEVIKDFNQ